MYGNYKSTVNIDGTEWEWQPLMASWTNDMGQARTNSEMVELIVSLAKSDEWLIHDQPAHANRMQLQVREFMQKMRQHRRETVGMPPPDVRMLRFRLIAQESFEVTEAILDRDMVKAIDGMCDLLYVVFGAAEALGVNLAPYFDEVHRTNMLKDPDYVDEYGKVGKPPGWEPPRIAEMLEREEKH